MFNNIKISLKIPLITIFAAALCCLIIGTLTYKSSSSALHSEVENKLTALLAARKDALTDYLGSINAELKFVSNSLQAINAAKEFTEAWNTIPAERGLDVMPKDYLQQHYIAENPNPTGQKENLDFAPDGTSYSRVHAETHPWFRQFLRERGYYDIFIFDLKGNLVYSVFKELDFATNLMNGEYKDSDLGNAFRAAAANGAKEGDAFFYDFKPYAPSAGVPASFIATPIFDHGRKIGVLAFQMPVSKINESLAVFDGLGETGETYAVGSDGLMRTNSRFVKEGESSILQTKIDTDTFKKAIAGEHGIATVTDYRGKEVLSAYDSVEFVGVRWAILAEQDIDEAMAAVNNMFNNTLKISVAVNLAIAFAAFFMSRSISKPLDSVRSVLAALADGRDDVEITGTNRKDEVGDLAKAAQVFKENAAEANRLREQQRETEIRAEQDKKQAMMQLADDFESEVKGIVQMVAAAATELSQTAEGVAVSIGQSSQTSAEAASAAEQTSSNVQSVASASEELSASVREISTQMLRSNQLVNDSVAKTEAADKQALSLSEATQRVKEVVELISDIAGKINLLSLNATIESARAGEAGKGFAVVASEVKNLANQTDKSIEEIVKVINDMNLASDDIIKSLNEIKSSINNISESSGTVAAAVEEQSATTNEIARNMQTAATGTDLIRDNLRTVSMGCAEANESAGQILQAAQELSQQSEMLNIKLDNFLERIRQG